MKVALIPIWLQEFEQEAGYMVSETKQEEIRNVVIDFLDGLETPYTDEDDRPRGHVDDLLTQLYSQGVVIKVEGKLPETPYDSTDELPEAFNSGETATDMDVFLMYCNGIEKGKSLMLKAGYVVVEPLL